MAKSTPKSLPDLPSLCPKKPITIDLETEDRRIGDKKGPGDVTGEGRIVGIAIRQEKFRRYIPVDHPETANYRMADVAKWLNVELARPQQLKIGANILYDLGWLRNAGVEARGKFYDIQVAEPLIDENKRRYSLDSLSEKYLPEKQRKKSGELDAVVEMFLGRALKKGERAQAYIHLLPASLVESYALGDVDSTFGVYKAQQEFLDQDELRNVLDLELRLIPLLLDMRWKGVRIDMRQAKKSALELNDKLEASRKALFKISKGEFNPNSPADISKLFDAAGYEYPRTAKTNAPSFTRQFLKAHKSKLAKLIMEVRKYEKTISAFMEGQIGDHQFNGRIHCSFNQLRSDEYGTVSGRFSSSNPNLQQVPKRDDEAAEIMRSLFVPDKGKKWWKYDYSQVEFRLLAHFARECEMRGSEEACKAYREDPTTDFHQWVSTIINRDRTESKTINFGLVYGMGKAKLAASLDMEVDDAEPILEGYHRDLPFVRELSRYCTKLAQKRGYVKTISGRRRRFPLYEPAGYSKVKYTPLPFAEAMEEYGHPLQRAMTYKAMNAIIQGSAADVMKMAMVDTYEAGCYEEIGVPSLTVHDELNGDFEDTKENRATLREIKHISENVVSLHVPLVCEMETGKNWYAVKEFK